MRPTDPRVRSQLRVARAPLTIVVVAGIGTCLAVIAQAFALTDLVVGVVRDRDLLAPCLFVGLVVAARAVLTLLGDLAAGSAATRVAADLRSRITHACVDGTTTGRTEGELATLATHGVAAAEPYLTRYVPSVVLAAVLPLLTIGVIASQDLLSAFIVLATLPLLPIFGALIGYATRDRAEAQWRSLASLAGHFVDVMRGLPTLVAYRRAEAQSSTIRTITQRYRRATMETLRVAFASAAVLDLVATLSVALVAVTVGVRLAGGSLDLETGLVVLLLAPEAYWPIRRTGAEFHAAAEGVSTFESVAALGAEAEADPAPAAATADQLRATNLSFRYPGRRCPAVEDLDLDIAPTGLTVLVGPSGSGKSTLLKLLAGLLVPSSGSLHGAGQRCTSDAWRSQVAWLPQRPAFLASTVADNLRLGTPNATVAAMKTALERVGLSDRVRSLGGLEAMVGQDGELLSAGERVRLALARCVLAERPWLMLDEPTAHLDPATRSTILAVIRAESEERAVVAVTHDPAMIAAADRVVTITCPVRPDVVAGPDLPAGPAAVAPPPPDPDDERPARFWPSAVLGIMSSVAGLALTATAGWLIVKAAEQPPMMTMLVAIVAVRTFGLARPVLRYAERVRSHDAALRLLARRRVEVYDAIVPLTPGRLGRRRGDVLASIVDDVDATMDRELRVRLPLRTYLGTTVVALGFTGWILPGAAVLLGVTGALGALVGYVVARGGATGPEQRAVTARAELAAEVLETVQVAEDLRMWQAGDRAVAEVADVGGRIDRARSRVVACTATGKAAVLASVGCGLVGTALLAAPAVLDGRISGPIAALLVLIPLALGDLALGVVEAGALEGRVRCAEARLAAYRQAEPAVTDPAEPLAAPETSELEGRQLVLGWERAVGPALDLTLNPGERVGVTGPSGSGKSTLAATLVRFIDPVAGSIRLGGHCLRSLGLDDVRATIGLVDDDPHVFATTLVENVRLARPRATDEEVLGALRAAHLHEWAGQLPDGLNTWLGDGHAQISGGERARLGVARSVLANHAVVVLDEPLAHLDRGTAERLTEDVLDGAADRSIVWITHSDIGLDRMDRTLTLG